MKNLKHVCVEIGALVEKIREDRFDNAKSRFADLDLKGMNQLVTDMDVQVEKDLVNGLRLLLPEAEFLTEESTVEASGSTALRWIIDPIDGTTNFVHGVPAYSISIALEKDGEIILGVVYELNRNEFFYAVKNEGAFLNGERINVSNRASLTDSLMATGFPYYDFEHTNSYLKVLTELMQKTRGIRRLGSAAVDLAYVACGIFDGFYEYSLSPWDVAAGSLLVTEAGGFVTDFKGGNDFIYGRSIVAGQKNIRQDLMHIIQTHMM